MLAQPSLECLKQAIATYKKAGKRANAQILHAYLHKCGFEWHTMLGNFLVTVLVDAGNLRDAQALLDKLAHPNSSSWNALITAYINFEELHHALGLYEQLQHLASLQLSGQNFVLLLKACAKTKDLERGVGIHGEIARLCMEKDVFVGSMLVDMYTKHGSLSKAQQVLDKLPARNVVTWNALIAGYAKYGYGEEALRCLDRMQHEGISPDSVSFLCGLKACGISGAIEKGRDLHAEIERKGLLLLDAAVGNTLVDMYFKCNLTAMAQEVFNKLPIRNVVTWTNLIAGLNDHGDTEVASKCFEQMQGEGISPDAVAVVCGLKAYGVKVDDDSDKELDVGSEEEHGERSFALWDHINKAEISRALPTKAKLPSEMQLCQHMNLQIPECVELMLKEDSHCELKKMHSQGIFSSMGGPYCQREVKGGIGNLSGGKDLFIGNTLIDMYAKRGFLRKAQKVFDSLLKPDQVSWNVLIAGYAAHDHGGEALKLFEQMRRDGFFPDVVTYVSVLKACGTIGALKVGLRIHGEITKKGLLEADLVIGSTLVDMYGKCGSLAMAHCVFDMLPVQNVVAWTSLMAGYTRHGFGEEAIRLFDQMRPNGVFPDVATVIGLLKACMDIGATGKVEEIHAEMERKGVLDRDLMVGNALIDMYGKCGSLSKAQSLFDTLPCHDVVSWNSLIAGYVGHGRGEEALMWLGQMQLEGIMPDAVTYATALQAYSKIGTMDHSEEVLAAIETKEWLKGDLYVGSTLVNMYAKCGLLAKAQEVLSESLVRDPSLWNALMSVCVNCGCDEYVLEVFRQMQLQGVLPDAVTFLCSLRACGNMGAIKDGQQLHARISQMGTVERNLTVCNAMIDMYAKCGRLAVAELVLDRLPNRDVVSWTSLILGYAEYMDCGEALRCLKGMQFDGVSPDAVTLACCLKACCNTGALSQGQKLHCEIVRRGLLAEDLVIGNILVNMYGRCGLLTLAMEVFEGLSDHDAVSWNGLLSVYAQQGCSKDVFIVFDRMKVYGTRPDDTTFLIMLSSCSQLALFHQSQTYFEAISKHHSILPTSKHYACMIDLLGRSGHLQEALTMIEKVGVHCCPPVWRCMLNACRYCGSVELAEETFEKTWLLDEKDPSAYVLLCQIKQENRF